MANAETVYRSIGPDGSVVFSDEETPGSESIEVQDVPTVTLPRAPEFRYQEDQPARPPYSRVAIISPANDETIRNNAGNFSISAGLSPRLRGSHVLEISLDGKVVSSGSTTSVNLENVDRGTHVARATVKSSSGEVIQASKPVTFHLLRVSVQHPKPAAPP